MNRHPQYKDVQELVDAVAAPEFAEEFRRYQKKWSVRFRKWLFLFRVRVRCWWDRLKGVD